MTRIFALAVRCLRFRYRRAVREATATIEARRFIAEIRGQPRNGYTIYNDHTVLLPWTRQDRDPDRIRHRLPAWVIAADPPVNVNGVLPAWVIEALGSHEGVDACVDSIVARATRAAV